MEAKYVDHMGDDLRVVNAARVSFSKESDWDRSKQQEFEEHGIVYSIKLTEQDSKLITYLAKHGHWTPFAHPMITIREKVPIFVARQRFKHMVGFVYNEVSRRYVDDEPEFYTPEVWRTRPEGSVKQGSGSEVVEFLELDEREVWDDPTSPQLTTRIKECYESLIEHAEQIYKLMIKNDVAPEQARMILPQSMYTEYYVTGSLAAWARAYKQRIDPHAQKEIQDLAVHWGEIIEPLFPVSWKALTQ
jgi:thymidylate synthase (FAD)